ncbi:MAG: 23S rRNA (uracil(1939)-C(5))-methyltransferase RlmD [Bacilli bacterium]|nr:23S rRNA (uracil(1939)-C(5))-methyltransferase RlmD [Bacilli bacterium]
MKINETYETKILRLNNETEGVGIIDGITTFIPYALPLEIVKVKIDNMYDNYARGTLVEILKESSDRIDPVCPYFYKCGGCNLMHLNYDSGLEFKKEKIESIFKKITNENIKVNNIYNGNNLYYRNKITLKVDKNKIGYYKEKTNTLIDIDKCFIVDNKINNVIKDLKDFINNYPDNEINEIMIRVIDNKVMISIDNISINYKDLFIDKLNNLDSIYINNNLVYGEKVLVETIDNYKFNISPKSFFQVNKKVSKMMYEKAVSYIDKSDITLDLYSGTGTITALLSEKSKKVIGIEVVKEAVNDANNNLKINNISNVEFICDKVENKIETLKKLNIDNIVLDPPRSGSDKKTLKSILEIKPNKIIYISCNPVTLARDYNVLKEKYIIKEINAYDMFSNTYHVETVMVLEKKDV